MLLGIHTYSYYLHGAGQDWADFNLPWPRQMSMFELLDEICRLNLDGIHLDDGALESLEKTYLKEVRAAAEERDLYIEYNFSLDWGAMASESSTLLKMPSPPLKPSEPISLKSVWI